MNVTKSSESHVLADSLSEVVVVKVDWSVRLLRFHSQSEHGRAVFNMLFVITMACHECR